MVCSHKPLPGMLVDFTQDTPDIPAMIDYDNLGLILIMMEAIFNHKQGWEGIYKSVHKPGNEWKAFKNLNETEIQHSNSPSKVL